MPRPVTVYTRPGCQQCRATERQLNQQHIPYRTVNLAEHPDALEKVKALGYQQAPVVVTANGRHWSGYRPDQIDSLVLAVPAATVPTPSLSR